MDNTLDGRRGWTSHTLADDRAVDGVRAVSNQDSRVLRLSGPLILLAELLMWVVLLWVGWTLVFASAGEILIDTLNRGPVSWTEWFYFVGYTLFTLGNGDYAVQDSIWQVVAAVAALNGLVFLTWVLPISSRCFVQLLKNARSLWV